MTGERKRRVLLVDDHPLTRKGLAEAIGGEADLEVCGEAEEWRVALTLMESARPDVVMLDLNLKDGSGWDLLKQLDSDPASPPVLVLSVCDEEVFAARLLRSGAMGYLMKDAPIAKVLEAVRKVLAGHIAVSDAVASHLMQLVTAGACKADRSCGLGGLSDRELQVLDYLRQGMGNREIAERLGVSDKTIGTYKSRLMEKLGVRTTPALIAKLQSPTE
jgi:DNA-binding NarL/FixJ family response regulator